MGSAEVVRGAGNGHIVGIDTGGTFTDIVVLHPDGEVTIDKSPTTPKDFTQGVIDAVAGGAQALGVESPRVLNETPLFQHGHTAATNPLHLPPAPPPPLLPP